MGWCDLPRDGASYFLFANPDAILADIRRVPRKESPIRQCQSKDNEELACDAYIPETFMLCYMDARALFLLLEVVVHRCVHRIGGARIVVCFDIYRGEDI